MPSSGGASAGALRGFGSYFVDQCHEEYSPEAHEVWREVLLRNSALIAEHSSKMHPAYVQGIQALRLPERVPRVEEINACLAPTGWKTVCVDGYVPSSVYVGLMSQAIFPVSRVIRRAEHIDFAPAPDFVHDVLGHLPMLFCEEFRDFLRSLARVMSRAVPNALDTEFYEAGRNIAARRTESGASPEEIAAADARMMRVIGDMVDGPSELTELRRMYVWSIEFGLMGDVDQFRIHGAALLSSPMEFRAVCAGTARIEPYSLDVVRYENAFSDLLAQYFVARDLSHMYDVMSAYEGRMLHKDAARTSGVRALVSADQKRRGHA
jgi:phenylalanine-4-hydroxylase